MPELPEVETMRRGVASVEGRRIEGVRFFRRRLKPITVQPAPPTFRRRLVDARILQTGRMGKRVVLRLDNELALVFEPRMTGLLLLSDPPSESHLRFGLEFAGKPPTRLLYWDRRGLGTIRLMDEQELNARLGSSALGPDALTITSAKLRSRLAESRRQIKVALLDQAVLAGVGNLYAAEILHVARLSPFAACREISKAQWNRLAEATRNVLSEAIEYEGSTLSDGTYRTALNKNGRYQNRHRVYAKAGQKCPRCNLAEIVRCVQAQRSTFYCPRCQR